MKQHGHLLHGPPRYHITLNTKHPRRWFRCTLSRCRSRTAALTAMDYSTAARCSRLPKLVLLLYYIFCCFRSLWFGSDFGWIIPRIMGFIRMKLWRRRPRCSRLNVKTVCIYYKSRFYSVLVHCSLAWHFYNHSLKSRYTNLIKKLSW